MIRDKINIEYTLRQFESILKINTSVADLREQVKLSRKLIEESIYEVIPEGKTIYDLEGHDKADAFLGSLTECIKNFSLIVCIEAYDLNFSQTLKSVNYLGGSELQLTNSFKVLSKKDLQTKRTTFFEDILKAFSLIKTCELRRIVCIIAVLENIGMLDAAAVLAHHIVLGSHT